MPVRYPPPDRMPPVSGGGRSSTRQQRIVAYEQPGPGFGRRVGGRLLSAPVIIPLV